MLEYENKKGKDFNYGELVFHKPTGHICKILCPIYVVEEDKQMWEIETYGGVIVDVSDDELEKE